MGFEIEKLANKFDSSTTNGFEIERIATATGASVAGFEIEQIAENFEGGSGGGGEAFEMARSIVDRTITEYVDSEITKIGPYAFYACSSLSRVEALNATEIGEGAFNCCSQLNYVSIPKATSIIDSAFRACSALSTIVLNNVEYVGFMAFAACTSLKSVYMNVSAVPSGGYGDIFMSMPTSEITIYVPESLISAFQSAARWSSMASLYSAYSFPEEA